MVELSMTVPRADLLEFQRVMSLLQTHAGKTPAKAVEMGAVFVAKALQAATVVSPRKRKVIKAATDISQKGSRWKKSGFFQWAVLDDADKSKPHFMPIAGHWKTKRDAEARVAEKYLKIKKRGLARFLWWKCVAKIAVTKAGRNPDISMGVNRVADRLLRVQITGGDAASVTITNSARYALKAFRSKGRATVDNAMRRAANNMRKYAERESGLKFNEVGK